MSPIEARDDRRDDGLDPCSAGLAAPRRPSTDGVGWRRADRSCFIAFAAPLIAPYDPETIDADRVLAPPDFAHLLGSDALGRDVLSRVIYGLRASLLVSISAVLGSLALAVPLGLLAGYLDVGWIVASRASST